MLRKAFVAFRQHEMALCSHYPRKRADGLSKQLV